MTNKTLTHITKLTKKERDKYRTWFATQDEDIFVLIMQKQSIRYYIQKTRYKNEYSAQIIFIGSLIETIVLYFHVINCMENFDDFWFNEVDFKNAKKDYDKIKKAANE